MTEAERAWWGCMDFVDCKKGGQNFVAGMSPRKDLVSEATDAGRDYQETIFDAGFRDRVVRSSMRLVVSSRCSTRGRTDMQRIKTFDAKLISINKDIMRSKSLPHSIRPSTKIDIIRKALQVDSDRA